MVRRWYVWCSLALLLAAAGGAWLLHRRSRPPEPVRQSAPAPPPGAEMVYTATLRAGNVVPVPVPVDGTLESVAVDVGQEVFEGQALGRIRNSSLESDQEQAAAEQEHIQDRVNTLEAALITARLEASRARADASRGRADLERAQKAHDRQAMLQREGATPRLVFEKARQDYEAARAESSSLDDLARTAENRVKALESDLDKARTALEEKKADLEQARQNASAAEIHSPASGLVVARHNQPGDEVTVENKNLLEIAVDPQNMQALFRPGSAELARIQPGQEAVLFSPELGDVLPARVSSVENGQVVVDFSSPSPALRPGMTAQVRLKLL